MIPDRYTGTFRGVQSERCPRLVRLIVLGERR
jgi:hypothetical protein